MELPRTEKALRIALADHLSIKSLPRPGWYYLRRQRYVEDYLLRPGPDTFSELLRQLRPFVRETPGRKRGQTVDQLVKRAVPASEAQRAKTYSRHMARLAARRSNLRHLREKVFDGRTLSDAEAEHMLRQVGPRYFHAEWFTANGIPLLTHRSYFLDPHLGPECIDWTADTLIRFEWGDDSTLDIPNASEIDDEAHQSRLRLRLPRGEIMIRHSSVLADIQHVALDLAHHYDWDEAAATVFILTGQPPFTPPIAISSGGGLRDDHTHFFVELRIEPWVKASTITSVYLQLQRIMLHKQPYPRAERTLTLFDFVETFRERVLGKTWQELHDERVPFPWAEAAVEWNRTHGKKAGWKYEGKRMSTDFERTWWAIVHPSGPLIPRPATKRSGNETS